MTAPPAQWLPDLAALMQARPELDGIGLADAAAGVAG